MGQCCVFVFTDGDTASAGFGDGDGASEGGDAGLFSVVSFSWILDAFGG